PPRRAGSGKRGVLVQRGLSGEASTGALLRHITLPCAAWCRVDRRVVRLGPVGLSGSYTFAGVSGLGDTVRRWMPGVEYRATRAPERCSPSVIGGQHSFSAGPGTCST